SRNHVRVRSIVSTQGEASRRSVGGLFRSHRAAVLFDIRGRPKMSVGDNGQHRHGSAKVVGDQYELSRRMNAHIRRASPAGRNAVEQGQLPVSPVDRKGADRAFTAFTYPVRLIGRI